MLGGAYHEQISLKARGGGLPIRVCGIWTCFGYGSSFTGITVTSRRSLCFPAEPPSLFLVLPLDVIIFFLLVVDEDVLALAFAEVAPPIVAEGFPG